MDLHHPRLVEGEDKLPVVVPATNPSRVLLDTALAESTAGRAERTRYGSVVHDGYFVDCSPILRRPILVAGLVHGDCGTKHQDKLGSAGDSVEPLVVQTSRINKHHIVQPLTPTSGGSARSLAGNTSLLTSNNTSSLEHVEGHPANEIRGSHEDSVRQANGEPAVTEVKRNQGGDTVPDKAGTRLANEEEARSRPANKEVNRSQDASQAMPRVVGHGVIAGMCSYTKGGICSQHGPGAKRKWRPVSRGDGGVWDKNNKRYYYVCDLSMSARKLKQTKLSFEPVTSPRVGMTRNHGESL